MSMRTTSLLYLKAMILAVCIGCGTDDGRVEPIFALCESDDDCSTETPRCRDVDALHLHPHALIGKC
jgi:hypothetical protein